MKKAWKILGAAFRGWSLNKVPRLSAALSYYTIFSLAPMIVIATAIASWALGAEAVNGQVAATLRTTLGDNGAQAVQGMVQSAAQQGHGVWAASLGVLMLILGATGVFIELQSSLNSIWEVEPRPDRGTWGMIRDRLFSLGLVLATAFLLLVSLLVSTALSAIGSVLSASLPGGEVLWSVVNGCVSFAVISALFALLFKYVPDIYVRWRDVWVGALVTGALFTLGKALIGAYLGRSTVGSAYGAAGSLAIVLLWVYYVSQIVFFGAEFTKAYANIAGAGARVDESIAVPVKADAREAQETVQPQAAETRPEARGAAAGVKPAKTESGQDAERISDPRRPQSRR
jgi:membrane protein